MNLIKTPSCSVLGKRKLMDISSDESEEEYLDDDEITDSKERTNSYTFIVFSPYFLLPLIYLYTLKCANKYDSASAFQSPLCFSTSSCNFLKSGSVSPSFSKSSIAVKGILIWL